MEAMLAKVLDGYRTWYNVAEVREQSPLVATAEFHEQGSGYVLIRSAELWSADTHEYVWFYDVPELTAETVNALAEQVRTVGLPMVEPKEGHRSTNLVCAVFCDHAEPEALKTVKKFHWRKSFQFSLHGWVEMQVVVMERNTNSVTGSVDARNTVKFLKSILFPKKRKQFTLFTRKKGTDK